MDELAALEDDLMGDDDILGAARRSVARAAGKGLRRPPIGTRSQLRSQPIAAKRVPLGLGTALWDSTSTSNDFELEVEPQRDFQGERLVLTQTNADPTAPGIVTVKSIKIGDVEQLPSSKGVPIEMFSATAVGAAVDFTMCARGCKLTVTLTIAAIPAAGDDVTVTAGLYGMVAGQ